MHANTPTHKYVALLRGINVGGHHKVPMAGLRSEMEGMGYSNIQTLLNSGNVIFEGESSEAKHIEHKMASHLESAFGFPIPVLVRMADDIRALIAADPFKAIEATPDIRLYVSFLSDPPARYPAVPVIRDDGAFRIIDIKQTAVCSVLDLRATKTVKGMEILEQLFGKNITTRNWNTIVKIADKL